MDQTADQIETHIERTRANLGDNLKELEQKVKDATDWRHHFENHPMTMMGMAFGGGIALATLLRNGRRRRPYASYIDRVGRTPYTETDRSRRQAPGAWDNIKGALIGLAATGLKDFVSQVLPGVNERHKQTQSQPNSRS